MTKKKTTALILAVIMLFNNQELDAKKKKKKKKNKFKISQLAPKYQKFFEDVHHIITRTERKVFLQLTTDRERDILIKAFWNQRDPTRGTSENEFRAEHYTRLAYVEGFYGRSYTRKGWETDRGKVYIILGKPVSIQRFEGYSKIVPTEVWHYQVDPAATGLPPHFKVVFFDRHKTGEYVLYSPMSDGPQKLLIGFQGKPGDYSEAYLKLTEFNSFLAKTSLSLIPGEEVAFGTPSMSSDFLLRNIERSPKEKVEDIYARKFLEYKGVVEVEYSANFAGSKNTAHIMTDTSGNHLISYMFKLNKLALDQYDDLYYAKLIVNGSLIDKKKKTIYQFKKNFDIRLSPREFQNLSDKAYAITDILPVIPGKYDLSIVVRNENSKQFYILEKNISIPLKYSKPTISAPILAYEIKERGLPFDTIIPFRTNAGHFMIDPENRFKNSDTMNIFFQVHGINEEFRNTGKINVKFQGERKFEKQTSHKLSEFRIKDNGILIEYPLDGFPSDYYELEIALEDKSGTILEKKSQQFTVTPLSTISRPQTVSKTSTLNKDALTAFITATQYMQIDKNNLALPKLEDAHHLNPSVKQFAMGYARCNYNLNKFEKIETILTPFLNNEKPDLQLYLLLGDANRKLGKLPEAIKLYRKLAAYHGLSVEVLNRLGPCYMQLGDKEEARKAWEHSLKIAPAQEKIKKLLRSLKDEQKK
ncbi:MAG: GWxTD domain-containing protein [bacterium]|nr:GWxTD domain-containing protein [bacterium]